ncbi:TPA: hypothetical protein VDW53_000895 [Pseudomonas aeruginosa]|nr:hypothetical protein [Pseudomonas aeruginosa]
MSEVKRYHFEAFIDNYYKHYQFILASDYDALAAEAQALRDELSEARGRATGPVDQKEGYTGWVTQYPGRAAKLWGSREIAELNWWPEDGQQLFRVVEVERIAAPTQGDNDD